MLFHDSVILNQRKKLDPCDLNKELKEQTTQHTHNKPKLHSFYFPLTVPYIHTIILAAMIIVLLQTKKLKYISTVFRKALVDACKTFRTTFPSLYSFSW